MVSKGPTGQHFDIETSVILPTIGSPVGSTAKSRVRYSNGVSRPAEPENLLNTVSGYIGCVIEGSSFIDRYKSIDRPNIVLSHSWWETEEPMIAWRQHTQHRAIQRAGREQHFRDYRLRIGRLLASSEETAPARLLCATYLDAEPSPRSGTELFKSVYRDSKFLILSDAPPMDAGVAKRRRFAVIRDYTMYDRGEAPQHYPPVERHERTKAD